MEWTIVQGVETLKFDLILTLALGGVLLLIGFWLQRRFNFLARTNVPAPVIAGLLFALVVLLARSLSGINVTLDATLRQPLQIAFFTVIGYSATFALLRAGGWRLVALLLLASIAAVLQTAVGIGVARLIGAPLPLGIICGALTLTGGPATGLAFTPQFESLGIEGAGALIIASATFGILISSIVANPVTTLLINRFALAERYAQRQNSNALKGETPEDAAEPSVNEEAAIQNSAVISDKRRPPEGDELLYALLLLLAIMGAGAVLGGWLNRFGVTLPAYVGAMVVAALVRNTNDYLRLIRINARVLESLGGIALALFLVLALMDLKLWQLAGLILPALVILCVQVLITILYALSVVFIAFGRDYEAAVTTSGYIGFGLGITPNAVANMETLARRFAPAPRSFLTVPIVGAFFIDFTNALIITFFINLI
jgi:ESS family glutamate:Na+ symporter